MSHYLKLLCGLLFAALLAACGGGGGSAGTPGTGTGTGGGTDGGTTVTGTPTVTVTVVDANGAVATGISVGGSYSAKAVVKDKTGAAVANRLVSFSVNNNSLAVLTPATALTDSSGIAKVAVAPTSITALGATTLTAEATVDNANYTGSTDFSVSASNLSLSTLSIGSTSLAAGGNTSLSVTALINGSPSTGIPINVTFSASCGRINGQDTSFSTTTNGSGTASASYSAVNGDGTLCSGPVTLSATSAGTTARTGTVNVAAPIANAVTFVSATPQQIYVSGSGALEQSTVKFKALSGTTPLPNVPVVFSIQTNPGGVGLNAAGNTANVTGTTDANGEVTVTVFSGTIPGPVKVRAALQSDNSVFAETQNLTVASGPPSQRFMSLSVSTYNIEGWNIDGTATTLTVRLADRQGNPVADGTVVNFTAEGGQVAQSCATQKVGGISLCSVDFISQNPRPTDGRVSVIAYASGTKDYVDVNGNNIYDAGTDTLVQIGDAYRDDNEDAAFNNGEFVVPRGGATSCSGAGWPFPSRANTCDNNLATTVRQQAVILYSSSHPVLQSVAMGPSLLTFNLASLEQPLLPMPAGTVVTADTGDNTPSNNQSCAVDKILPSTVPNIAPAQNPSISLATSHAITLKDCATGDLLAVTIQAPSGLKTTFTYNVP